MCTFIYLLVCRWCMCTCACWHMLTWRGQRQQASCPISLYLSSLSTVLLWAWRWTSALAILLSLSSTALGLQLYTQAHPDLRGCWESELRFWAISPARVFKFLNIDYDVTCEQRPLHFLLSKLCALCLHLLPWFTELATVSKRCWMWVVRNIPCSLAEGNHLLGSHWGGDWQFVFRVLLFASWGILKRFLTH